MISVVPDAPSLRVRSPLGKCYTGRMSIPSAPVLALLLALAPHARARPAPGWEEAPAAYQARLSAIAEDIAAVSSGRVDAAALVGVAWHESGFAADVDAGQCYHAAASGRCDGGRAASLWQMQDADPERRETYRTNRREAAREALRRIWRSRSACARNAPAERLAAYAGGVCDLLAAKVAARGLDASVRKALALWR